MPQSCAHVLLHIIYGTKHRVPFLENRELREELYKYMAKILDDIDCPALAINGVEDHVHILCCLSRSLAIKGLVQEVKASPSQWLKKKGLPEFYWQTGYGAFSVSQSQEPRVRRYIVNQEEHHRNVSFRAEFAEICRRHGVEFDERSLD